MPPLMMKLQDAKKTWVNLIDYATGVEDTCLYVDLVDTLISHSLSTGTYMYIHTCMQYMVTTI